MDNIRENIGQMLLTIVENWQINHPENKNVDSMVFVNEILNSGIIPQYLSEKHADKSRYQQYNFID